MPAQARRGSSTAAGGGVGCENGVPDCDDHEGAVSVLAYWASNRGRVQDWSGESCLRHSRARGKKNARRRKRKRYTAGMILQTLLSAAPGKGLATDGTGAAGAALGAAAVAAAAHEDWPVRECVACTCGPHGEWLASEVHCHCYESHA